MAAGSMARPSKQQAMDGLLSLLPLPIQAVQAEPKLESLHGIWLFSLDSMAMTLGFVGGFPMVFEHPAD